MNDPHVESLTYEIGTGRENICYGEPPPVSFDNHFGSFHLEDGKLTVELGDHFSSAEQACQTVDPFLRSWELRTDLNANLGQLRFKFLTAEIIDRKPPRPGENVVLQVQSSAHLTFSSHVALGITCNLYPDPPTAFATTVDVESAHARWAGFRDGKEPLQSMSYFVLTLIEGLAGNRKQAANHFGIDLDVLHKIGELSSATGDATTARKANFRAMTGAENAWLEAAIRKVILRLGEYASAIALDRITFADMPKLE